MSKLVGLQNQIHVRDSSVQYNKTLQLLITKKLATA